MNDNDTNDEACLEWGTDMYGLIRAEEGLIFWREAVRRCEAQMEEMRVRIARLEGELEIFRKHHKETQK